MHNLFLGTAKHIMTLWKDQGILTKHHFKKMQERIGQINVPLDIGRIPYKIESSMASLTAYQWKNWTCIYSLYVLHNILISIAGFLSKRVILFVIQFYEMTLFAKLMSLF